ncbi:MAG TPA: hypothetical protein VJS43_00555 [Candidatus Acidoferrales bacterium]|nr:hypothetical protein [Candidatus Acidoferrales bacterium]
MLRKLSLLAFAAMLAAAPGFAQDHSGFNGKWALSQGRSDFGGGDTLTSRVDTIAVNGDKFTADIHSTSDNGDDTYKLSLTTDGKSVAVPGDSPLAYAGGIMVVNAISAEWKGNSLVLIETLTNSFAAGTSKATVTYALSPDGKLMSITSTSDAPFGFSDMRLVFEKI